MIKWILRRPIIWILILAVMFINVSLLLKNFKKGFFYLGKTASHNPSCRTPAYVNEKEDSNTAACHFLTRHKWSEFFIWTKDKVQHVHVHSFRLHWGPVVSKLWPRRLDQESYYVMVLCFCLLMSYLLSEVNEVSNGVEIRHAMLPSPWRLLKRLVEWRTWSTQKYITT